MQLSTIALSALFAQFVIAAPVLVVVTETVYTTIEEGATQAIAAAYTPTSTISTVATTGNVVLVNNNAVEAATVTSSTETPTTIEAITTTAIPTTTQAATATVAAATTTTPATTATTATQTSSSTASSGFESEILAEHDAKRALHGVDSLSWDSTLATYAQNYADAYDCSGTLKHSGGPYGENLALGYTTQGAVDAWYAEGDNFDYNTCDVYDHFTQVIWKSTTKVGCGYKTCDSYWGTYIICSYDPAGNYVGQCTENVLPLV